MTISERDRNVIWHPFSQHQTAPLPFSIAKAKGAYLFDENGKSYLDLISSWWVNLHGHAHPEIAQAIYQQAMTLEHVIFSGFTHTPAVLLAEELLNLLPRSFSKIFYSDNGSTAIEVALKMAYQYWRNQGETERRYFISFENGYHGDTFGAMSVGKESGYFSSFHDLLFQVKTFPYPSIWFNDKNAEEKEQIVLDDIKKYLKNYAKNTAAIIIEPLVQGAGGMNMCRPEFLVKLQNLIREHHILIIYDEVMTGFGRTGDIFACNKASTQPDIICLAKGLTGGFLPLAVTACQEKIYEAFLGDHFGKALAHGHSFTANPLGCAAALASLKLLKHPETIANLVMIEELHKEILSTLADDNLIEKKRYCGTIAAFNLKVSPEYGSNFSVKLRDKFMARGILIRPLGNVIYFLPPYCVQESELRNAYQIIIEEIQGVTA